MHGWKKMEVRLWTSLRICGRVSQEWRELVKILVHKNIVYYFTFNGLLNIHPLMVMHFGFFSNLYLNCQTFFMAGTQERPELQWTTWPRAWPLSGLIVGSGSTLWRRLVSIWKHLLYLHSVVQNEVELFHSTIFTSSAKFTVGDGLACWGHLLAKAM